MCDEDPDQGLQIGGLRLLDHKGVYIIDLNFMRKEHYNHWITRKIPIGQSIIGMKGNYGKGNNYITSLGFIMWTP